MFSKESGKYKTHYAKYRAGKKEYAFLLYDSSDILTNFNAEYEMLLLVYFHYTRVAFLLLLLQL